jgi:glycosyltransferase EpsJ
MMAMMLQPIRTRNVSLAYQEGRLISFVKRHNTKMFATLKANR